ncbi:13446_t:CDS:2 [Entrophospora sp. SA101]|nr:13446_t:CDS:2 [Entrophospora sp. SA101]
MPILKNKAVKAKSPVAKAKTTALVSAKNKAKNTLAYYQLPSKPVILHPNLTYLSTECAIYKKQNK